MSGIPIISTREREIWTYENKRRLDRLSDDLNTADVGMILRCKNPSCPDPSIRLVEDETNTNSRVLECGCKRRYFEPRPGVMPGRLLTMH